MIFWNGRYERIQVEVARRFRTDEGGRKESLLSLRPKYGRTVGHALRTRGNG